MGAKGRTRRNFENGILTDDPALLVPLETQFDDVWARAPIAINAAAANSAPTAH